MQKVIYRGLVPLFFIGILHGTSLGQVAAASKNVNDFTPDPVEKPLSQHEKDSITRVEDSIKRAYLRGLEMPRNVIFFMSIQQSKAAQEAFTAFKDTLPADTDPFLVYFLERMFLKSMAEGGATGKEQKVYQKRDQKMLKFMRANYGNRPEVIWWDKDDIPRMCTSEEEIEITTRQIEADSTYLPAYETRGKAYASQNRWEEACRDFSRLPACIRRQIPEAHSCR